LRKRDRLSLTVRQREGRTISRTWLWQNRKKVNRSDRLGVVNFAVGQGTCRARKFRVHDRTCLGRERGRQRVVSRLKRTGVEKGKEHGKPTGPVRGKSRKKVRVTDRISKGTIKGKGVRGGRPAKNWSGVDQQEQLGLVWGKTQKEKRKGSKLNGPTEEFRGRGRTYLGEKKSRIR